VKWLVEDNLQRPLKSFERSTSLANTRRQKENGSARIASGPLGAEAECPAIWRIFFGIMEFLGFLANLLWLPVKAVTRSGRSPTDVKIVEISTQNSGSADDTTIIIPVSGFIIGCLFSGYITVAAGTIGFASGTFNLSLGARNLHNGDDTSTFNTTTIAKVYASLIQGTANGNFSVSFNQWFGPMRVPIRAGQILGLYNNASILPNGNCDVLVHIEDGVV
jgi:hypothetical protein